MRTWCRASRSSPPPTSSSPAPGGRAFQAIEAETVTEHTDTSHGMRRVEARSPRQLAPGTRFPPDGPGPTGLRALLHQLGALRFIPVDKLEAEGYGRFKKFLPTTRGRSTSSRLTSPVLEVLGVRVAHGGRTVLDVPGARCRRARSFRPDRPERRGRVDALRVLGLPGISRGGRGALPRHQPLLASAARRARGPAAHGERVFQERSSPTRRSARTWPWACAFAASEAGARQTGWSAARALRHRAPR